MQLVQITSSQQTTTLARSQDSSNSNSSSHLANSRSMVMNSKVTTKQTWKCSNNLTDHLNKMIFAKSNKIVPK